VSVIEAELGPELRRLRRVAGLTLEELAEASGVSVRAISDMERGRSRGPQHRTVTALVSALGLVGAERAGVLGLARAGRRRASGPPPGLCDLPRAISDFTGREQELQQLLGLVAADVAGGGVAAVAISGQAGAGKTTLAVHAAGLSSQAFRDGRFFVDLRGLDPQPAEPGDVLFRLLRALGIREASIPVSVAERAAVYRGILAERRLLVVADNAASEAQVRPLLPGTGAGLLMVTSRRLLTGLENVHRIALRPMPAADSHLLLSRVLAASAVPASTDGLEQIAALCGHLPLALRIAGNRLVSRPSWTAASLAGRLASEARRLDRLSAGDLQVSAAIMLSYAQLRTVTQAVFRALSLIPGPDFSSELASAVAGVSLDDADSALDELIEAGLMEEGAASRFRFHDLIRLFAAARLEAEQTPAEQTLMEDRMTGWLLDTTIAAGRWFEPDYKTVLGGHDQVSLPDAATAQAWLQTEAPNWLGALRAVAAAGRDAQVSTVAESLHWFSDRWVHWGRWHEVFALSSAAARRSGDLRQEATQLNYLSWAQLSCLGEPELAAETALQAARTAAQAGDTRQHGWSLNYAAHAFVRSGQTGRALPLARQSATLLHSAGDWDGYSQALTSGVWGLIQAGRHAEALDAWDEVCRAIADPVTAPSSFVRLGTLATPRIGDSYAALGRWEESAASFRANLAAAEQLGIPRMQAEVLLRLAKALRELGHADQAIGHLEQAREICLQIGHDDLAAKVSQQLAAMRAGLSARPQAGQAEGTLGSVPAATATSACSSAWPAGASGPSLVVRPPHGGWHKSS
jgi:transcriptional regulator with XRE-family HTH domain/tetratricopeptide (TPR) repeat protein